MHIFTEGANYTALKLYSSMAPKHDTKKEDDIRQWRQIWRKGRTLKFKWTLGGSQARRRRSRRRPDLLPMDTPCVFRRHCVWCYWPSYCPGACFMRQYLEKGHGNHTQWRKKERFYWTRSGDDTLYTSPVNPEYPQILDENVSKYWNKRIK